MPFDPRNVDVEDFLECLDIRNARQATADEIRFSCPFPNHENGDENTSAYMNIETSKFFCHGCHERGDAISFTTQLLGISPIQAIRMLKERYQPGYLNPDAVSMREIVRKILYDAKPTEPSQPRLPDEITAHFEVNWPGAHLAYAQGEGFPACDYMFGRGFTPETLDKWEFGYDECSGRVTFAVRDLDGTLIGFKGRAWHDRAHPKYLVLGDKPERPSRYGWPCYFTSRVVFGAHRVEKDSDLIVCEGELNAVALDQKLGLPAVAINGSHFTDAQARVLRSRAKSVTLFTDTDSSGESAQSKLVAALKPFVSVAIVPPHEGDPASMSIDALRACLDGARSPLRLAISSGVR